MSNRNTLIFAIAVMGLIFLGSCKKQYRCLCSYNNKVQMDKDLGLKVKEDAQEECDSYDSTVAGETWKCSLY